MLTANLTGYHLLETAPCIIICFLSPSALFSSPAFFWFAVFSFSIQPLLCHPLVQVRPSGVGVGTGYCLSTELIGPEGGVAGGL